MDSERDAELAGLLVAAMAGEERAYAEFLTRVAALVRGYAARRITGGEPDPEDVVQETLLAIHLKRHTWQADRPVLPWIFGIARFKLIDGLRRRGRRAEVDIDDFADTLAAPEPDPAASPREIGKALDALAPGQRAVVGAISIDGRSIAETATHLGMSETAVRVSLHRGLAAIAKRVGQAGR